MTDFYSTQKEAFSEVQEKANRYDKLKAQIRKEIKRHRTLIETSKEEEYKLAHSIIADELGELLEE